MADIADPRVFADAAAATPASARLHALAVASLAGATVPEAETHDREARLLLEALLAPGRGEPLAAVFASAPSVAVYRHLWRLLDRCAGELGPAGTLRHLPFALPVVVVAGIEGGAPAQATLPCVLADAKALAGLMREHAALEGNQAFALAPVLVGAATLDLPRLPELLATADAESSFRALAPEPIALTAGAEAVHLRFVVGAALAAPGADLLHRTDVGPWAMPLARALGHDLAVPGTSVLALPRAPQSLLHAVHAGRVAQREIGVQVFATNAIRKLRAAVGEPTAVISAHRAPTARHGGELRLSLSSPFDPREAEGFRCPLEPLENVADVVAMLRDFLAECRVTDVRVVPGAHGDRDPATGLPLLFKGDDAPALPGAVH